MMQEREREREREIGQGKGFNSAEDGADRKNWRGSGATAAPFRECWPHNLTQLSEKMKKMNDSASH
jgi:hypothetical protein